ncbi:uncharacterized protein LOC131243654 isoform X2 [Magnolia sinica]|uniref:uncharacterized protein LOC131243654 isoform X2 n=1 Tax=Magnolia sinica TaxID=86752 RepID=UPI00265847D3|nr:uncharacterized protein LOC131243654 isoform X2 [Magnolia sinica]XP_058099132.1 uncharacterized protein LOC131243654 isoform X2 [Magnolia sinica]
MVIANSNAVQGHDNTQTSEQKVKATHNDNSHVKFGVPENGSSWVDIFIQEMMNSSALHDARVRAMRMLEAFERSVIGNYRQSEEHEIASLKEQWQILLRDNQILKRAVAIQHERNLEQEDKVKEVQQLKHVIGQYQEQVRTLEEGIMRQETTVLSE